MATTSQELLTVGDIARRLNTSVHRVSYAIETYRIAPVMRAGIIRLFSLEQLPAIESALRRTAEAGGRMPTPTSIGEGKP